MAEKELLKACPLLVQCDINPSLTVPGIAKAMAEQWGGESDD